MPWVSPIRQFTLHEKTPLNSLTRDVSEREESAIF